MKISRHSRHWANCQQKFLSLILISAVHSTASAQFNFTLDLMLGKNQTASTEKCLECAGVIRTHIVAPSDQPLSLSPPVRPEPLDSKLAPLARAMTSRSSVGLLVLQGNQVLYEGYTDGVNGQTGLVSFSRAKSVISLAIGKACSGLIKTDSPIGC